MASEKNNVTNELETDSSKTMVSSNVVLKECKDDVVCKETSSISKMNGEKEPEAGPSTDTPVPQSVDFKVIFNKQKFDVTFAINKTVAMLKEHIQTLTGVPPAMQKVMFKGLAKDDLTLEQLGVTTGAKIMVVGSTLNDVLAVSTPSPHEAAEESGATGPTKEPLSKQKSHSKVIEKGIPDDALPGIKNEKDSLPPFPLAGMVNKSGGKVRLTFKLELDQLWIGTKERTEKIPMSTIKNVVSEAIDGHEEYHIMGIQLGPTEASRYWIYWVPAQYVDAIKDAILGSDFETMFSWKRRKLGD